MPKPARHSAAAPAAAAPAPAAAAPGTGDACVALRQPAPAPAARSLSGDHDTRASASHGGWIGVDLDGTLATEDDGSFKGAAIIGAPIAPMVDRVKQWLAEGRRVKIFTSRMHGHGMPLASGGFQDSLTPIQNWCREHLGQVLEVTNVKEFGLQELWDDRAVGVARNTGIRLAPHQGRSAPAPAAGSEPPPLDCRATADALAFADGLTLRAAPVALATLDPKARSVEATIATEAPVEVYDYQRDEIVREILLMSGLELPASRQVPMLDAHNRWSGCAAVIGSTRDLRVEGPALVGRNCYAETEPAEDVWQLVRAGHLTDNSVGYRVRAAVIVEPGQSADVDGRTFTAPANQALRLATAWRIAENSNCPIGADPLAKMRAAPAAALPPSAPAPAPRTGLARQAPPVPPPPTEPSTPPHRGAPMPAPETAPAATIDTEARAELAALRKDLAESRRAETIRTEAARYEIPAATADKLVADGASVDTARAAFLEHVRANRPQPGAPAIIHGAEATRDDLACALVLRAGHAALAEKHYGAKRCETATKAFRGVSLLDTCRHALRLAGHPGADCGDREDLIRMGFSTGSLPYILGNAAHKFLLQGWGDAAATWRQIVRVISVADFKAQELLRLQDTGDLDEVPSGGTVKYAARQEDREQLKAKTYARNFGVSRQDIINDDLGVFTEIPRLHGVRAAKRLAKLVWAHIMANPTMNDGIAFFQAASHLNLNTSCALSADNLTVAIKGFRNQVDANGDPIDVQPAFLVVPPTLEETAKQLCFSNIILPYGGTSGTTRKPTQNVWAGTLTPVIEPRLEASAYTGYATDAWYLFANPAEQAAVVVGFLNGNENPTLERFDTGADTMGVVYRVSIDAGVRVAEYRAASKQTA